MNTDEMLKYKALSLKAQIHNQAGSDLVDSVINSHPEQMKAAMRNICAFISPELFQRVEVLCTNLSISKRQVIEMALNDFMQKADKIIDEVDPFADICLDEAGLPVGSREVEGE